MASADGKKYEIEYKFEVGSQQDLEKISEAFNALSSDVKRQRDYVTTIHYYDTDNLDLFGADVILRTMDEALPLFKSDICVKTEGVPDADGCLKREEYGNSTSGNGLKLDEIKSDRALELIKPADGKKLSNIFNTVGKRKDTCLGFDINGKTVAIDVARDKIEYVDARDGQVLKSSYEMEIEFKERLSDSDLTEDEVKQVITQVKRDITAGINLKPIAESRGATGFRLIKERKIA